MKIPRAILTAALALFCMSAFAQWQWLDRDGRKVFSDRAPPAEIPEKNILKRPGRAPQSPPPSTTAADVGTGAATPAPAASGAVPVVKKNELDQKLEEKKKQAEQAEAAKRKAEEARAAQVQAENCARAKQAKAALDSGVRMATTNAKGEREIMDDAARATETKRLQGIMASDCK
jgi:type IV secretory pathway VirB10-like protein